MWGFIIDAVNIVYLSVRLKCITFLSETRDKSCSPHTGTLPNPAIKIMARSCRIIEQDDWQVMLRRRMHWAVKMNCESLCTVQHRMLWSEWHVKLELPWRRMDEWRQIPHICKPSGGGDVSASYPDSINAAKELPVPIANEMPPTCNGDSEISL